MGMNADQAKAEPNRWDERDRIGDTPWETGSHRRNFSASLPKPTFSSAAPWNLAAAPAPVRSGWLNRVSI